jgi:hypothetical protein
MRWVRGTRLDIFGCSRMRRLERTLVDEYRATILEVAQWLSPQTVELAAEIAGPDLARGDEDVKLRAVEIYRTPTAQRLEQLRAGWLTASSSIVVRVAQHRPGRRVVARSLRNMSIWIALGSVEPPPKPARFDSGLTMGFGHGESSLASA